MSNFLELMNNQIIDLSEIEEIKLMNFLRTHFEVIEKFIDMHKKANVKLAKKNGKLSGIETKVYDTLARNITRTEEQFNDYKLTGDNLAKYISKIRIENNCQKQIRKTKGTISTPLQAVVSTQIAVTQQQPAKFERPQKQEEDKSSSVVVEKIDLENESQPVVRVGDLSTGLVSQDQYKDLIQFFEKFESFGEVREPLTKLVQVNRSEHYKKQWTQEDEEMAKNYVEVIKLANINLKEWQNIKNFKFDDLDIERFKTKWGTFKKDFEKSVFIDYMKKYFEFHQVN